MLFGPPRLPLWAWTAMLCGAIVAVGVAWISAQRIGIERLHDAGSHKLDLYAASLDNALGKYEYLPAVAALRDEVVALLRNPGPTLEHAVNLYLAEVNADAHSAVLYVLDRRGLTLASSNWNEEASFVGMDLGYRPYVRDALDHGAAASTASGRPAASRASTICRPSAIEAR